MSRNVDPSRGEEEGGGGGPGSMSSHKISGEKLKPLRCIFHNF